MILLTHNYAFKFFSFTVLQFFILFPLYGQEMLSKEQEREIKMSDSYFYGEGTDFEEAVARQLAIDELVLQVSEVIGKSEKKDEILQSVKTRAKIAQIQITGRKKMIAWIEKTGINSPALPEKQTSEINVKPEKQIETPAKAQNESLPVIVRNEAIQNESPNEVNFETQSPKFRDTALELSKSKTFQQFYRIAETFKRQGKLIYGNKKTSFANPEKCLIAVFSPEGTLVALFDEGKDVRKDLLSGKTVQDPEQYYKENELFWIQIN